MGPVLSVLGGVPPGFQTVADRLSVLALIVAIAVIGVVATAFKLAVFGSMFGSSDSQSTTKKTNCPSCGARITAAGTDCEHCGESLPDEDH